MAAPTYFEPDIHLDRTSPVPLYHQIAEPIESMILSGALPPGTRLEDELSMARRLRVSRPTARRALQTLGDHGLLVRRRGVGTQVAPTRVHRPVGLSSVFEDLVEAGRTPTTEILSYQTTPATVEIARRIEVDPGVTVTVIRRLRKADGEPVALILNLVRTEYAPSAAQLEQMGFYQALAARGIVPTMAKQTMGARKAGVNEARMLQDLPGAALLTMERTAYDEAGRVVEYGDMLFRSDRFSLNQTVFAR